VELAISEHVNKPGAANTGLRNSEASTLLRFMTAPLGRLSGLDSAATEFCGAPSDNEVRHGTVAMPPLARKSAQSQNSSARTLSACPMSATTEMTIFLCSTACCPYVGGAHLAGSSARSAPIPHRSDHSDNEGLRPDAGAFAEQLGRISTFFCSTVRVLFAVIWISTRSPLRAMAG
jgi:hypothetical protein